MQYTVTLYRKMKSLSSRLRSDERGAMAVLLTVMLTGLFGFVSVAVDTGVWYATKRRLQTAADAAARAAAHEQDRMSDADAIRAAGAAAAARMGFDPESGATVDIRLRDDDSIRAVISVPARLYFAKVLRTQEPILSASAAAAAPATAPPCLTVLDADSSQALMLAAAKITAPTCRIQVNSTSGDALKLNGSAFLEAAKICVAGNYSGGGTSVPVDRNCPPLPDPLAAWTPPEPGPCDYSPNAIGSATTLKPGVYCSAILINGAQVTFEPGIYILKNGGLTITAGANVTGTGVGFLLVGDSTIDISANSVVHFVAPVSGPMAGIVFAHDRNATEGLEHKLVGHSDMSYEGAVYLPKQKVLYRGHSSSTNIPPFTTYIVGQLSLAGQAHLVLDNNYAASAVPVAGKIGSGVVLVE